jgi:hypothetical protein
MRLVMLVGMALVGSLATEMAMAQSIGVARMPSTVAQYFGVGYGAGHHAPIVRTPGYRPERVARVAFVPSYYGPLQPAPYAVVGCNGADCAPTISAEPFWYGPDQGYPGATAAPSASYVDPSALNELRAMPQIAPPGIAVTAAPWPASFR